MDYAKAASIVAQHAPELTIDPDVPGQRHVVVRRMAKGSPHSITLPVSTDAAPLTDEAMEESFVVSLGIAKTFI